MKKLHYDLKNEKVHYLLQTDETLKKLISYIQESELIIEEDGFKCIIKYIVGQQISDKARETIWLRICNTYGNLTPKKTLMIKDEDMRNIGLSQQKVEYIKNLATAVYNKYIDFNKFSNLSNEEIIEKLTKIKGIGRWTAEMYLIFSLGRENVLSKGDGTVKRTLQWMYNLEELPTPSQVGIFFEKWKDFATIVSSYLWKSIELDLTSKPFEEVIK